MLFSQFTNQIKTKLSPLAAIVLCVTCAMPAFTASAADQPFNQWVDNYKREARALGIAKPLLDDAFAHMEPNDRVVELDRKQPEGTMTFARYKERVINAQRIKEGRRKLTQHRDLLNKVSKKYGVQPRFIVALWGIETNYGTNTGGFDVIEALATLAYDGRRGEFFRKELTNALQIINDGHISLDDMRGSWAGAMGQCQFMPSSFIAFAQDGNGDGKKDIWNDLEDVFASIANYLSKSGWDDEYTWGRRVAFPAGFSRQYGDIKSSRSLLEWAKMGIRTEFGSALPQVDIQASLVYPDDASNEAYLVYNNYKTVMKWNRSLYFATAVGLLSDEIGGL
ncbi:MAG: lytic murein transglycosylase [Alphaproteobacteria bacterium]|nr:lytic murein transglycosylase [Alphaproteobacteria bacterium]